METLLQFSRFKLGWFRFQIGNCIIFSYKHVYRERNTHVSKENYDMYTSYKMNKILPSHQRESFRSIKWGKNLKSGRRIIHDKRMDKRLLNNSIG